MSLSFLAPQFLWTLLAIPLVILLHFIRSRRKQQQVSALFLWKEAKEQAKKQRRFWPTYLLILQLLFVGLAGLALSQPNIERQTRVDQILIIDASASMAARDSDGVRLTKAIRQADGVLDDASQVAIIRAGLDASVVQALSTNIREARNALRRLNANDKHADLTRAVSLARSISPEAEIHVFTDNEPPQDASLILHAVGKDALNVGITSFDLGIQQAFVSVSSNHPRPQELQLELYQNAEVIAQANLLVPSNGQSSVSFPLESSAGFFEARIASPSWDALHLDDVAFAGQKTLRVVLHQANEPLERALSAIPNLTYQVRRNAPISAPEIDVHIFTGPLPEEATEGNYLLFSPENPEVSFKEIREWDRSHPTLRFVDLSQTVVGLAEPLLFTEESWLVLAQTAALNPVLLAHSSPKLNIIAANFHPLQTDMTNRSSFPLFITNSMASFRNQANLDLGSPLAEGSTLQNNEAKTQADEPGLYTLENETYAVSLLSSAESKLPVFQPTEGPAPRSQERSTRAQTLAFWFIALALLFLLAEWLVFLRGRFSWPFRRLF